MLSVTTLTSTSPKPVQDIRALIKDAVWAFRFIKRQRLVHHLQEVFQNDTDDFRQQVHHTVDSLIKEREIMDGGNGKLGMAPVRCFKIIDGVYRNYGGPGSTPKFSVFETSLSPAFNDSATYLSGGQLENLVTLLSTFKCRPTTGDVLPSDQFQVYNPASPDPSQFRRWVSASTDSTGCLWRTKRADYSVYFLTDGRVPAVGKAYKLNTKEKKDLMWGLDLDANNSIQMEISERSIQIAGLLPNGVDTYLLSFCNQSFDEQAYRYTYTVQALPEQLIDRETEMLNAAFDHITYCLK